MFFGSLFASTTSSAENQPPFMEVLAEGLTCNIVFFMFFF